MLFVRPESDGPHRAFLRTQGTTYAFIIDGIADKSRTFSCRTFPPDVGFIFFTKVPYG
jgi:hypothetical protein